MDKQYNLYQFESIGRLTSHRKSDVTVNEYGIFLGRLGLVESDVEDFKQDLMNFVSLHQANILWYVTRLKKELKNRRWFFISSVALLALVPIAIIAIGALAAEMSAGSPGTITAQITAVLTGFIGVHRALSSWMDKRQLIGHFHKASASLKEILYSIEEKWGGKAKDENSELNEDFIKDIKQGIESARKIVKKEEEDYFARQESIPSIDLAAAIKAAGKDAASLVATHRAPALEKLEKQLSNLVEKLKVSQENQEAIMVLNAEINTLKSFQARDREELAEATDDLRKTKLRNRIDDLQVKIDGKITELGKLRAKQSVVEAGTD